MRKMTMEILQIPKEIQGKGVLYSSYHDAETQFGILLGTEALDKNLSKLHPITQGFEQVLKHALVAAYQDLPDSESAHQFLQRILYRINRLKLFWYDDLKCYENERSLYLWGIHQQIEEAWQTWEMQPFDISVLKELKVGESLKNAASEDLDTKPSGAGIYFRDDMGKAGYQRLLEIASLDGLVEASQLSRMLGGVANEIHAMLTKLFLEEYGNGRLSRKHSTFFENMLNVFNMQTKPEAYFDRVPWEVLAGINQSFLLTERKRHYLRYIGGLLYTEIAIPSAFRNYSAAARRLNLPQAAMGYWDLHIKEDARHGSWMLHDIALPLVKRYPADAWELVLGYKQQRLMSHRAGEAIARSVRRADSDLMEDI